MSSLTKRVALVTGGSRGIGRAIAIALAKAGADVALTFRARASEAEVTRAAILAEGRRAEVIQADVSVSAEISRMVETAGRTLGGIDILVNNAGIIRPQTLEEISERDWHELIATNLTSAFLAIQQVIPHMRAQRWGRVINLSSVAAQLGGIVGPHYAASKAGMAGLTHAYAALLASEGITVNSISPALIDTEMLTSNLRARTHVIPAGRFGAVDEVASVAVMLAGNGYITGQTINVNGGWYMS
jgi:3-oxoacyl-[acyl-carrier protein] reductase